MEEGDFSKEEGDFSKAREDLVVLAADYAEVMKEQVEDDAPELKLLRHILLSSRNVMKTKAKAEKHRDTDTSN